jgi:hypothetical protein
MLARHLPVLTSARFVNRAVDYSLGGFADLALSDVEVVHDAYRLLDPDQPRGLPP